MSAATRSDVLILGGGLAGLSLALQLRERCPDISIRVLERRTGDAPATTHKVGESTVEIGAHYFANTLGLREHLDAAQVRKFGFRFFFSDGVAALDRATELGISRVFPTPSWQLERGTFENFLAARARGRGIDLDPGTRIRSVTPGTAGAAHSVCADRDGHACDYTARWLVDASGRAGLLRHQHGLAEDNGHRIGAAWFRIDARLDLDAWCDDDAWRGLCQPRERWRSTNHLCGPGYWVWLIALASGAHSVGIVADASMHPIETFNTFERAQAWLARHQPALARQLAHATPLDFGFLRNVSQGCRQVFSTDRWAITGEAGRFLDPFYSPGSDFIALSNGCITELVAREIAGNPIQRVVARYERMLRSFHDAMLPLYRGQYPLFGDARVMTAKVLWDYAFYWGILCPLAIGGHTLDPALLAGLGPRLAEAERLNLSLQAFLRHWHATPHDARMPTWLDQQRLAWFARLNARLGDRLDADGIRARIGEHVELLHALAGALAEHASADTPGLDVGALLHAAGARARPELFRHIA